MRIAVAIAVSICVMVTSSGFAQDATRDNSRLSFQALPDLPDEFGVAGPIVGVVGDSLIVAGGANFGGPDDPELWDLPKLYHDKIRILNRRQDGGETNFVWQTQNDQSRISQPVAYSSVASTSFGVLCMGGEDSNGATNRAFLLTVDQGNDGIASVHENDLGVPDLPRRCTAGGAAIVDDYVYVVAGQVEEEQGERAASRVVWRMDLRELARDLDSDVNSNSERWELVVSWPDTGPRRMHMQVTAQHDGFVDRLYVIGGRRFLDDSDESDLRNLQATADGWSFNPAEYITELFDPATGMYSGDNPWKRIADSPVPLTAGTAIPFGPAHIIIPAGDTGEILKTVLDSGTEMKDFEHPGFPKTAYAYHTITDTWTEFGSIPANQVTTPAVRWGGDIILVSGEIRPRVRTTKVWRISVKENRKPFGAINMTVVVVYLLAMVGVGGWFTLRNKSTDQYFRGGKTIPWWAAGCSIFATMLSSITYMAIPAKSFAQDWVYALGNVMILVVAPIAVFVALPFYRRIDATSAYEYLEKRFNRAARLVGSGSFTLFHVFRMGVVLALAALALASVTPLTPAQCVIVMGSLSIVYCTLGGVEAVIWTDTFQTVILLFGAILCLYVAWIGASPDSLSAAIESGKLHTANVDFESTSFMTMAIWVVIVGGAGQNIASYTADQAVVQRYMTTSSEKLASRSIWLNGMMAIPAIIIFFGMGTTFWMFYRSHPERLDPTIATDGIMPLFISHELPIGLAGLVVAGIFAAAQSTVSTSMNSGATTIITDFLRPANICKTEKAYLWLARFATLALGILGTITGLFFVDPTIKSLFDQFIGILGMFLGVLAGLFALGATTRRANGPGSLAGATVAILFMITIVFAANDNLLLGLNFRSMFDSMGTEIYQVSGYLYATIGIVVCYVVGYLASMVIPAREKDLDGLTLWRTNKS